MRKNKISRIQEKILLQKEKEGEMLKLTNFKNLKSIEI